MGENLLTGLEVKMYTKKECSLCDVAKETILRVQKEIPFEFNEIDIESKQDLYKRYKYEIPVVFINGQRIFTYKVNEKQLRKALKEIQSRQAH